MDFSILQTKAKENGIKIGFLTKGLYRQVASIIPESEEILGMASGFDKKSANKVPIIVTTNNVYIIKYAGTLGGLNQTCIPISRISSISSEGITGTLVITDGAVQHKVELVGVATSKIIETVNQAKVKNESGKTNNLPQKNNSSVSEQIQEMKKLLDDDLITQEEFDKKKKQILGI